MNKKTSLSENEQKILIDIINDFKVIKGNKLSIHQSITMFLGTMFVFLSQKILFPKNSDLKSFTNEILVKYLKRDEPFKNYLFSSRYNLIARIQKEVLSNLEYSDIVKICNDLIEYLDSLVTIDKKKPKKNIISPLEFISEWSDFIKNKE